MWALDPTCLSSNSDYTTHQLWDLRQVTQYLHSVGGVATVEILGTGVTTTCVKTSQALATSKGLAVSTLMLLLCPTPLVASFLLLPGQTHKALLIMNRPLSALLNTELQADAQPFINDPVQLIRPHGARSCSQPLVPRNGIIMLM